MHPEDLHPYIEAAAPVVVTVGCLVMFLRAFKEALPFSLPMRWVAWGTGLVIGGCGLVAFANASPEGFVGALLGTGLVVYVVRARLASAKTREQRAERLRQARGHERRRAPPPLPGGRNHTPNGGTP